MLAQLLRHQTPQLLPKPGQRSRGREFESRRPEWDDSHRLDIIMSNSKSGTVDSANLA